MPPRRPHRLRTLLAAWLLCLPLLGASAQPNQVVLPDFGDPASQTLSPAEEHELGQMLLRELRHQLPVLEDLWLSHYLNSLGERLVSASSGSRYPFTFLLVRDPSINAFAAPGGIIAVNTGLIETTRDESELAAVLAHEIAHVTQRHLARLYYRSQRWNLASTLGLLAAAIIAAHSPEAGRAAIYTGVAANASARLAFTRDNEREADRIGHHILAAAGFDARAAGRFFQRLQAESLTDPDRTTEFLQTHPLTTQRIADALSLRPETAGAGVRDSLTFRLARARVLGLDHSLADLDGERGDTPELRLARATALLKNDHPRAALAQLQRLPADWRASTLVRLMRAQAALAQGQTQPALRQLRALYDSALDNPAILASLGRALLAAGRADEAFRLLSRRNGLTERWPTLLKLRADAAARSGRSADSHEALARYYAGQGAWQLAAEQVRIAESAPDLTAVARARLGALKKEIESARNTAEAAR